METKHDYIERSAVKEMLDNARLIADAEGEYVGYCCEDISIDSIPAADVALVEWIKVTDRLPEENHPVMVTLVFEVEDNKYCRWIDTNVVFRKGKFVWWDENKWVEESGEVTHWVPYPTLPAED